MRDYPGRENKFPKIFAYGARYIDYRMGIAGAVVMAGVVFGINFLTTGNLAGSSTAALKQGLYTFLAGGFIMRSCEHLAVTFRHKGVALAAAVVVPSAVAITLTFGVHSMKGTPRPVESTLPTAMLVIPSTAVWAMRKRKRAKPGKSSPVSGKPSKTSTRYSGKTSGRD